MTYDREIGPFSSQEQTANGNVYLDMLENYVYPLLEKFPSWSGAM